MAKRHGPKVWLTVVGVTGLALAIVFGLSALGTSEDEAVGEMSVADALELTEATCMGAAREWAAVNTAGNDDSGIPSAVKASRDCDRKASALLAGSSARVWANDHCKAVVEGMRDVARWQVENGPRVFTLDVNRSGPVPSEVAASHHHGMALMGLVDYHRKMCISLGVVD